MAWTNPTTVTTSDTLSATFWNTQIRDNLSFLKSESDTNKSNISSLNTQVAALFPVGMITPYAGTTAPPGWLLCNGDTLPNGSGTVQSVTANFATLYGVVGSAYGAAGKLPDLRGRTIIGVGQGAGLTDRARGATVGAEGLPSHTHPMSHTHGMKNHTHGGTTGGESGHTHTFNGLVRNDLQTGGSAQAIRQGASYSTAGAVATHTHNFGTGGPSDNTTDGSSISDTGPTGSGDHGVMQPSLAVNYIIKY